MIISNYFRIFAAEGSEYGLRLGNSSELDCSRLAPSLPPRTKRYTIMTQILVTLNEDATTLHVRKAIELLRGVASVKVFKGNAEKVAEKRRQEAYVKESLTRAFDEVKRARRGEHKMMTDEEFMAELKAEGIA